MTCKFFVFAHLPYAHITFFLKFIGCLNPTVAHKGNDNNKSDIKFKFLTSNSNSSLQIQIHHFKFKFLTSNSNSSLQIQIHHFKFKFITSNSNSSLQISASIFKIKISHFCHQNFSKFLRLYTLFPWKFLEISLGHLQCFCSNTKDLINFKGKINKDDC
jgi:hypothetical protein